MSILDALLRLSDAQAQAILDLEQVLAPDVLHRDEVRAVDATELEDLADVRVRELTRDLRFIDEHLDEIAILAHRGQDSLDRDDLLEALDAVRLGLEDLRHAAGAGGHAVSSANMNTHGNFEPLRFGEKRVEVGMIQVFSRCRDRRRGHSYEFSFLHDAP